MSSTHNSLPPEIREALSGKMTEERERIVRVWKLLGLLEEETLAVPDTEAALAEIDRAIERGPVRETRRTSDRSPRASRSRLRQWAAVAAAFFIVSIGSIFLLWRLPVTLTASPGQQIAASLPDGSTVQLNSGSSVRYARRFESWPFFSTPERKIHLEGEAFFEVQPGDRPFIVESFNARILALGTGFNVRARMNATNRETIVTLSHGSVLVTSDLQPDLSATLTDQGDIVRVATTGERIQMNRRHNPDLDRVLAWRRQGFVLVDTPLIEAVEELERRYALSIEMSDPPSQTDSITVLFTAPATAEEIVQAICLAVSCTYRQTSTGFVIF